VNEERPFIKYVDIERLGNPENDGIFKNDDDDIVIEEKVDGGNGCIWVDDGVLHIASRNRDLTKEKDEKAFAKTQKYLHGFFKDRISDLNPQFFYYIEHMVQHTITYNDTMPLVIGLDIKPKVGAFGKSPLFIGIKAKGDEFRRIGIPPVWLWKVCKAREINDELINSFMVRSAYYEGKPEGVVLKNYGRMNMYGRQMFAKVVLDEFKEQNRAVFGGIKKDNSDTIKLCDEFVNQARIRKKILYLTTQENLPLSRSLMHKLPIIICEDVLKEEYSTIMKNYKDLNISSMKQLVAKKCLNEIDWMIKESVEMNEKQ